MTIFKKRFGAFALLPVLCVVLLSACVSAPKKETDNRKKAEAHYKLGYAYLTDNRYKEAYVEFQTVLDLEPRNKHALNALGVITSSPGFKEYDKAVKYFKKAISIDPDYSQALNNLGTAYVSMGKLDEGIKYFRRALENPIYANPESAYSNIAYAQYLKGDFAGSVITCRETISKYPEFPEPYYVLGLVYMKLGKIQDAVDAFNKALNIAPESVDVHWEIANAYLRLGENVKAVEHFRKIAETGGDSEKSKKASEYIELLQD